MAKISRARMKTAYHESGHAVAHHVLGLKVYKATIQPHGHTLGHVSMPGPMLFEPCDRRIVLRGYIIGLYAGFEAETVFDPNGAAEEQSESDYQAAWDLLRVWTNLGVNCSPRRSRSCGDEAWERYQHQRRLDARRLIKENWSLVERLAKTLLKRGSLSGDQIERILTTQD